MTLKSQIRSDVSDVFLDTDDFADSCLYQGDSFGGQFDLIATFHEAKGTQLRNDLCLVDGISAIGVDFEASVAEITANDPTAQPRAGDVITWTDQNNQPRDYIVFPRVSGRCFHFSIDRLMASIYTFAEDDLTEVVYVTPEGNEVEWLVIEANQRGVEQYDQASDDMVKVIRMQVYGPRATLSARGIAEIQRAVTVKIGEDEWAVEVGQSDFGPELVKLGLVRKFIARHQEMEAHGSV